MDAEVVEVADILGKKSAQVALVGGDGRAVWLNIGWEAVAANCSIMSRTAPGRGRRFHSHVAEPWPALPIRISRCYPRSGTSPPRHERERLP